MRYKWNCIKYESTQDKHCSSTVGEMNTERGERDNNDMIK